MSNIIFTEERQQKISELFRKRERVFVNNLCEIFKTPIVSNRYDLQLLDEKGTISYQTFYSRSVHSQKKEIKIRERELFTGYSESFLKRGNVIITDSDLCKRQNKKSISIREYK